MQEITKPFAAAVQAAVAAFFEQKSGEIKDCFNKLPVTLRAISQSIQLGIDIIVARLTIIIGTRVQQELPTERPGLRTDTKRVLIDHQRQDVIEAIQHVDPVIQVTSWERPDTRECIEVGRKLGDRDADSTGDEIRQVGRLQKRVEC